MNTAMTALAVAVAFGMFGVEISAHSQQPSAAQQSTARPMRVGGEIKFPAKTKDVPPVYPASAQAAKVEGLVIASATIGPDGKVTEAQIVRSVPLLDVAALEAIKQWEFAPTIYRGSAVPLTVTVTLDFSLPDSPVASQPSTTLGGVIEKVNHETGVFHLRNSNLEYVYGPGTRFDPFKGPSFRLTEQMPLPIKPGMTVWVKTLVPGPEVTRRVLAVAVVLPVPATLQRQ